MRPRREAGTPSLALVAGAAALVAACGSGGGEGPGGGWQAARDTVGDTVIVRTVAGSLWGDTARLVSEVSIGVLEGADPYMFGSVRALAVGPDGRIHVMDAQVPVLRTYGPDGRWIRDVGGEGAGPGEYRSPDGGLAVMPDGRIVVRDAGNGRFTVYSAEGEYLEEWPRPSGGGFNTSRPLVVDPAGALCTPIIRNRGVPVWDWEWGIARVHPGSATIDTLAPPGYAFEEAIVSAEGESGRATRKVPYTPEAYWAYSPRGYFVTALSTDYRVDLFRPDSTVLRLGRDWEPVSVSREEAESLVERQEWDFRRSFPSWRWNGPPIPDTKPPFKNLVVGDDGRIWLPLHTHSERHMSPAEVRAEERRRDVVLHPWREPVAFDVFEPDGRYLGRVEAPPGFQRFPQPVLRGDRVWAVVEDELEVQRVHRFRIEHSGG